MGGLRWVGSDGFGGEGRGKENEVQCMQRNVFVFFFLLSLFFFYIQTHIYV